MLSYRSTAEEIGQAKPGTVLLPIGSVEQHGPHLPIGTDTMLANDIAEAIGARIGALVLPAMPISTCREHRGGAGSVWMDAATWMQAIKDIAKCLQAQGFRRLILYVYHGGVFAAGPVTREINADSDGIKVIRVDMMSHINTKEAEMILEAPVNIHACEFETSLMLYLHEELVRRDKIDDCVPDAPRDYLNYVPLLKLSRNGVWGMPSLATKEKGEALFRMMVDKAVEYIEDVQRVLDENIPPVTCR